MIGRHNVLLLEKLEDETMEFITDDDQQTSKFGGFKIHRIVEPTDDGFETIVQGDPNAESIDISILKEREGYYLASVDKTEDGEFVWTCCVLGKYMATEDLSYSTVMLAKPVRICTDEEVEILNEVFPEYYDNAF